MSKLAVVQYKQALRISEVTPLHWEDVFFDSKNPENSRIRVCRHVFYSRYSEPKILPGFKNSKQRSKHKEMVKEQPMFPETFEALKSIEPKGISGLIFRNPEGSFFSYRQIQYAYNKAFKRANLSYSSTHVLRHGGTRSVYNETGDLAVAQQILGNSDIESTMVYARREKGALTKVAKTHWERHLANQ